MLLEQIWFLDNSLALPDVVVVAVTVYPVAVLLIGVVKLVPLHCPCHPTGIGSVSESTD